MGCLLPSKYEQKVNLHDRITILRTNQDGTHEVNVSAGGIKQMKSLTLVTYVLNSPRHGPEVVFPFRGPLLEVAP